MTKTHDHSIAGPLKVTVDHDGETTTLSLEGEFDLATLGAAKEGLVEALKAQPTDLRIDLSGVTFIDSTGIAFLLSAATYNHTGRASFVPSSSPAVRRVLSMTGVDRHLRFEPQENPG